jgi:rhodanese-related sulfurtransferase
MTVLISLKPGEAAERLKAGNAVLVDIRESDEFAREHAPGAVSHPMSTFDRSVPQPRPDQTVIYTCRTGQRTAMNGLRLAACVPGQVYVVEGGLEAWKAEGLPTRKDASQPIELMRQVQMTAGGLILLGAALALLIHPAFWGLSAFVGAGLFFAGATGFCGMARLLAAMPWNRPRTGIAPNQA